MSDEFPQKPVTCLILTFKSLWPKRLVNVTGFLPPANEVSEDYVFTPICQSFCSQRGVCIQGVCIQGGLHPVGVCIEGSWADPPPHHQILCDTVNERPVRILLECILVWNFFQQQDSCLQTLFIFEFFTFSTKLSDISDMRLTWWSLIQESNAHSTMLAWLVLVRGSLNWLLFM